MDDDDLRRGKPSCHKAFDEATAILAGDALQSLAFHVLAHDGPDDVDTDIRLHMLDTLALAAGSRGMAGGQAIDLAATGRALNIAELERTSLARYASVTGENYTTDQRVYETLRDEVIPLYKRFLDGLMKLQPETEEVKQLNRLYIGGAELIYEGFKQKMYGQEMGNEPVVRAANDKIEQGRAENEKWRVELDALVKKYKLKEAKN